MQNAYLLYMLRIIMIILLHIINKVILCVFHESTDFGASITDQRGHPWIQEKSYTSSM